MAETALGFLVEVFISLWPMYTLAFGVTAALVMPPLILSWCRSKRLGREHKYLQQPECKNCGTYQYFEIPLGICLQEFLKDKRCKKCQCELGIMNGSES